MAKYAPVDFVNALLVTDSSLGAALLVSTTPFSACLSFNVLNKAITDHIFNHLSCIMFLMFVFEQLCKLIIYSFKFA